MTNLVRSEPRALPHLDEGWPEVARTALHFLQRPARATSLQLLARLIAPADESPTQPSPRPHPSDTSRPWWCLLSRRIRKCRSSAGSRMNAPSAWSAWAYASSSGDERSGAAVADVLDLRMSCHESRSAVPWVEWASPMGADTDGRGSRPRDSDIAVRIAEGPSARCSEQGSDAAMTSHRRALTFLRREADCGAPTVGPLRTPGSYMNSHTSCGHRQHTATRAAHSQMLRRTTAARGRRTRRRAAHSPGRRPRRRCRRPRHG